VECVDNSSRDGLIVAFKCGNHEHVDFVSNVGNVAVDQYNLSKSTSGLETNLVQGFRLILPKFALRTCLEWRPSFYTETAQRR
jgi:hypothetical protein